MSGSEQFRTYHRSQCVVFRKTDEPFGGLSNMAGGYPIYLGGLRIRTSEALYQACRFPHLPDVQRMIISQISPMTAKMKSKPYRENSRPDWDQLRIHIMRWCLRIKLANNWNSFSELLLRTGDRPIVEESFKDDFWGAKPTKDGHVLVGTNALGRLLMELREQIKIQGTEIMLNITPPPISQFLLLGRPIEVGLDSIPPQGKFDPEQGSLFSSDNAVSTQPLAQRATSSAYPRYRVSGLPWVPHIPESWQVLRNSRLFGHRVETGFPDLPILEVSLRTGVRVRDMENLKRKQVMSQKEKYKRAAKGDIAYNMMRMWQGAVGPAPVDGLVSPAYVVVKPYDEANSSYYSYLFRTAAYMQEVNKFSRGIVADRNRLYWESFKQMPSLVPPRPEQDQIVAYLRAQDAHIARFIKTKRDLINLLTEQKLRIIDHAVTRGLDAAVPLKQSGIEWLGDVPSSWELCRADYMLDTVRTQIRIETLEGKDVFLYSIPSIAKTGDGKVEESANIDSDKLLLKGGELLVSKLNPHKRYVLLTKPQALPTICSSEFVPLVPRRCDASFATYVYQSWTVSNYLRANVRSATRSHSRVEPSLISKMWWAWPSIEEQKCIVDFLATALKPLDDAIQIAQREIHVIRECRDRLIADVVTGQEDVRSWQPDPDDVVDDAALAALGEDQEDVTEEEDGDE